MSSTPPISDRRPIACSPRRIATRTSEASSSGVDGIISGEPTPYYSSRSSYFGIVDLAGFKKDRFYIYQAHWRPDLRWLTSFRTGRGLNVPDKITPVHVFTSGDEAELFLNGKSLGRHAKGQYEYRLRWDSVTYVPGTLKVVAYKNGKRWAEDSMVTAGAPARLAASVDRSRIRADGHDLAFVTVRVTDAKSVTAPRANNAIRFSIDGPGEIIATDNGDPTDMEPFPSTSGGRSMAWRSPSCARSRGREGVSW